MGKPTISMAIFNSYVKLPEGRLDCMGNGMKVLQKLWISSVSWKARAKNGDLDEKSKRQTPTKEESHVAKAKQKHKPWYQTRMMTMTYTMCVCVFHQLWSFHTKHEN